MQDLPLFDPAKALGAEPDPGSDPAPAAPPRNFTVTEVAELIKSALERHTPSSLRVIGQVSNLSARGHWYFSLKDEDAVVSCVAWASAARGFGFVPDEGDEVVATGHLSHYGPQGRTQLYVRALEPVGAGALELRFRALCEELRRLGYFDEAGKKPLPPLPRRIAVVTSAGGAAVHDVLVTAAGRLPSVRWLILDVRVQGEGAAEHIAEAIRLADARRDEWGLDAILVTRGGGSAEDLWAFNERVVADAAYACALPLVAAIGHESDTSVIELVADARAATPTQAAVLLVPSGAQLAEQVDHLDERLKFLLGRHLERLRQRLALVERFALFSDPAALVRQAGEALAGLEGRLARSVATHVQRCRDRIEALGRHLASVDAAAVLNRGYSYTTTADGRIVASVKDVGPGERITTRVADGSIESVVDATRPSE
jgi:exodeoxyribonuclease VII large subunit